MTKIIDTYNAIVGAIITLCAALLRYVAAGGASCNRNQRGCAWQGVRLGVRVGR